MKNPGRTRTMIIGGAVAAAAFAGGAALAVTASASATTDAVTSGTSETTGKPDPGTSMRSDEHLLTGTTARKVTAAAEAKEPTATIQRVETDSDGVYEAHMVRADGTPIIVQVGKDFTVSRVLEGGGPRGGQGPNGAGSSSSSGSATSSAT